MFTVPICSIYFTLLSTAQFTRNSAHFVFKGTTFSILYHAHVLYDPSCLPSPSVQSILRCCQQFSLHVIQPISFSPVLLPLNHNSSFYSLATWISLSLSLFFTGGSYPIIIPFLLKQIPSFYFPVLAFSFLSSIYSFSILAFSSSVGWLILLFLVSYLFFKSMPHVIFRYV